MIRYGRAGRVAREPDASRGGARQASFALRVPAGEVEAGMILPDEEHVVHEHRWWSLDEIVGTEERVYPPDLAATLRRILGQ